MKQYRGNSAAVYRNSSGETLPGRAGTLPDRLQVSEMRENGPEEYQKGRKNEFEQGPDNNVMEYYLP